MAEGRMSRMHPTSPGRGRRGPTSVSHWLEGPACLLQDTRGLPAPFLQRVSQCTPRSHLFRKGMELGETMKAVKTRSEQKQLKGLKQLNPDRKHCLTRAQGSHGQGACTFSGPKGPSSEQSEGDFGYSEKELSES